MTTITSSSFNFTTPLTEEQVNANSEIDAEQQLSQEDFFSLLSQQLAYQDPFSPVDNSEMIAQMASFTTAEGIATMGSEFAGIKEVLNSSQALEASSLVGKKVLIPSDQAYLTEGGTASGSLTTTTGAYNASVSITDKTGNIIRTLTLGDVGAGNQRFDWDGLDSQGNPAPAGAYTFAANGMVNGQGEALATASYAHVESVSLGGGTASVYLNLKGLGGIELTDAIEVAENI
ncbi:flagellar hook assembly protein FlgD [uncultured Psychromonas sp.]|uniref:flagellar hook assembly protein FlgD n=1 Tax=uncultured Psychromonas sp. TaxID=173974 RepID=UPI00261C0564|nr:flagellar hook assembly protein FlgD [uncultured Psychromonas sp.]